MVVQMVGSKAVHLEQMMVELRDDWTAGPMGSMWAFLRVAHLVDQRAALKDATMAGLSVYLKVDHLVVKMESRMAEWMEQQLADC